MRANSSASRRRITALSVLFTIGAFFYTLNWLVAHFTGFDFIVRTHAPMTFIFIYPAFVLVNNLGKRQDWLWGNAFAIGLLEAVVFSLPESPDWLIPVFGVTFGILLSAVIVAVKVYNLIWLIRAQHWIRNKLDEDAALNKTGA